MKVRVVAAVFAALAAASPAMAQSAWSTGNYVQGGVGIGFAGSTKLTASDNLGDSVSGSEDLKAGLHLNALIGHQIANGFAVEAEALYLNQGIKTHDLNSYVGGDLNARVRSYGALANLKWEAPVRASGRLNVSPYVGAGAGYGDVNYKILGQDGSRDGFMWQLKAGLAFHVTPKLTWDLGYKYINTPRVHETYSDPSLSGSGSLTTHSHALMLDARYNF